MQVNSRIQNPTNFFFSQANIENNEYAAKIEEFTKKLINTDQCTLCKRDYDFTLNMPRILIHCGHTFCTSCLRNFHKNNRVRCPMCLKLVKQIYSIDRLPINHTIFTKMADSYNKISKELGEDKMDIQPALYKEFEASSKMEKKGQQRYQAEDQQPPFDQDGIPFGGKKVGPRIDEESGLEWCEYHQDRIKHFLCIAHRETCCRACNEVFHNKNECNILDLYEVEDMHGFLSDFYKKTAMKTEVPINNNMAQTLKPPARQNFVEDMGNNDEDDEDDDDNEDENGGDESFEDEEEEYEDLDENDNPVGGYKPNFR